MTVINTIKPVNVGIIGCGGFGNFHIDNLLKMEGVNVAAIMSRNEERLAETAKKLNNTKLYTSYKTMLEDCEELDAIVITLPPGGHGDIELLAAEHGVNMYIEKPIELSYEKALQNEKAIKKAGIICSVGYQSRYCEGINEIKGVIAGKKTGLVEAKWINGFPGVPWWKDKSLSGGQIVEQSTHLFDALRYLYGDVKTVYTQSLVGINDRVENSTVEDCSSTIMTFKSGIIATVMTACYIDTSKSGGEVGLKLFAEDMRIEYNWGESKATYSTRNETVSKSFNGNGHFVAMSEFINAVRTNDFSNIRSDYSDAVKTLMVTLAANESMETGCPVQL